MKYTHKAPFDKGYNGMVSAVEHPEMMGMEFGVVKMAAGDVMHFDYAQEVVLRPDERQRDLRMERQFRRPLPAKTCSTRVRSCCMCRRIPR